MTENIENTQELNENSVEAQATENTEATNESTSTNENSSLSLDSLLEKALTELEAVRKENSELKSKSQSHLSMIEKLIMKDGAYVPRDESKKVEEVNTSAQTYNKPLSLDDLRGKLFIN